MSHLIEGFPRANQKATAEQTSLTRRFTIIVIVCLLPSVSVVSCVGSVKNSICTTASDADGTANGEAVINPRIQVAQTGFQQANSVWIRDGESVNVEWDRVDLHVTKKMAECHFETLTSFTEN